MGEPRRFRKKYESPFKPWDVSLLEEELRLIGKYGLKNKRELRRFATELSKIRDVARQTFGLPDDKRKVITSQLLSKLYRMGLISENATIDDVLKLTVEDILRRRLQTLVYEKGLAKSIYQARQLITHGHIVIGDRVVDRPNKIVYRHEEDKIKLNPNSPLSNPDHPIWEGMRSE
jgi:small subunit ribosomal protein S4